MKQLVRASTVTAFQTDSRERHSLAPSLVEAAVSRLGWIALTCAAVTFLAIYLESRLQPEIRARVKDPALLAVFSSVILAAVAIKGIQQYRLLSPVAILNLGLAFELLVSAAISFSETSIPMPHDGPVLGASKVALWIGVVGFTVPNRPWVKFATALGSASTWPLAYLFNLHLYGYAPLPLNRLLIWIHMPYLMAFVTYGMSKRMWRMERAVQKARDIGSYQLVSLIGKGGMGEVWRARHRMLAREAAIKLVRSDLIIHRRGRESRIELKRFEQEAQAIASLESPHTVYLYDFGVSEDGSSYYVMELLDGISLQALVNRFGPQPPSRVVSILRQVCESLEEAHRKGLVHRDVKPTNILACRLGIEYDFVKVLDFGLVKNVSRKQALNLTLPGAMAGTPAYMAPEVIMGAESIDARVDIYGLGCVAYFLLTGSPVFEEKTPTAMMMAHVHKPPEPPSQRSCSAIDPRLEAIVLQCLAKRPEQRPQAALEVSRALADLSETPRWRQEDAEEWWQTNLPILHLPGEAAWQLPAEMHGVRRHADNGEYEATM